MELSDKEIVKIAYEAQKATPAAGGYLFTILFGRAILAAHEAKKQQDRAALASQAQPVPEAIESLVSALAESRGWMRDYSRSIIEAAIEREQQ